MWERNCCKVRTQNFIAMANGVFVLKPTFVVIER